MANTFEPVIGSGFDALAAQRQFWARHNADVDTSNIGRANAAEQTQNSYLAQLAQARQAAMDRDSQAQQQAEQQSRALAAASLAQQNTDRQFGYEADRAKQQYASEDKRTAALQAQDAATTKRAELKSDQAIENTGSGIAIRYAHAQQASDAADAAFEDAQKQNEEAQASLEDLKVKHTAMQTKGEAIPPEELVKRRELKDSLATSTKSLRAIASAKRQANDALARLITTAEGNHMVIDPNEETVTHMPSKKTWTFKNAAKAATENWTGPWRETAPGSGWEAPDLGGETPALAAPSLAQGGMATPASQPLRVGRFIVTPQ